MQKVEPAKWRTPVFFLTASLVLLADQLSKLGIRTNLEIGQSLFDLGWFQITRVPPNTGAAFGLFQGQLLALTIASAVGVLAVLLFFFLFWRLLPFLNNKPGMVALGLVLGGILGNLIDRLYLNGVSDFIVIGIWPAFNLADSAIVVGVATVAFLTLRSIRGEKRQHG